MKKLILTLTAIMMVGCDKSKSISSVDGYNIVIVDSCEYIRNGNYYGNVITHKGNCKYCQERMKKMIKEVKNDN